MKYSTVRGINAALATALGARAERAGEASPYTYRRADVLFFLVVGLIGGFVANDLLMESWARDARAREAAQSASVDACVAQAQQLSDGLEQCVGLLQGIRDSELTSGWVAP